MAPLMTLKEWLASLHVDRKQVLAVLRHMDDDHCDSHEERQRANNEMFDAINTDEEAFNRFVSMLIAMRFQIPGTTMYAMGWVMLGYYIAKYPEEGLADNLKEVPPHRVN